MAILFIQNIELDMKLKNAVLSIFALILISACNKNKDFNLPELSCSPPSKNIQFFQNSILGEWKSVENESSLNRDYESTLIFTDSTHVTKTILFTDTNEQSEGNFNYSIEHRINDEPCEFTITLYHLVPNINSMIFCEDEFIIFNEDLNFWERYERN